MQWRLLFLFLVLLNGETKSQNYDEEFQTSTYSVENDVTSTTVESVTVTEQFETETGVPDFLEDFRESDKEIIIAELERPKNLGVVSSTQRSITLNWDFSPVAGSIEGYNIHFAQEKSQNVKLVDSPEPVYELQGLGMLFYIIQENRVKTWGFFQIILIIALWGC